MKKSPPPPGVIVTVDPRSATGNPLDSVLFFTHESLNNENYDFSRDFKNQLWIRGELGFVLSDRDDVAEMINVLFRGRSVWVHTCHLSVVNETW